MIRPNPFRNIERYPLDERKKEALRESFRETGFWGNVVCRRVGTENHGMAYELAYGHHRWAVLLEEAAGTDPEIDIILRTNLTDEDMLRIMARENMQEWGTSATVEIETVRAVVTAFAAGRIQLPAPDQFTSKNLLRAAPGFAIGGGEAAPDHPYTASTIAPFLGWHIDKVKDTLGHLEMIEAGILDDASYRELSTWQAMAMTAKAREIRNAAQERAKQAEVDSAAAQAEAEAAAERARVAEEERQQAEAARREAMERRDAQLAEQARVNAEVAKANWEAAQRQREQAEARAGAKDAEAAETRQEGAKAAGEAAQEAAEKMRGGASVKSVLHPEQAGGKHRQAEDKKHPMEAKASDAARLIQGMLRESDIAKYLTQVTVNQSVISPEARHQIAGALLAMAEDANSWRAKLLAFDPVTAG